MQLPSPFTPVETATPRHARNVIAIRLSCSGPSKFEVLTAHYDPEYRQHSPWQTVGNDSVTDSGNDVLGWTEMPEWLA